MGRRHKNLISTCQAAFYAQNARKWEPKDAVNVTMFITAVKSARRMIGVITSGSAGAPDCRFRRLWLPDSPKVLLGSF